MPTKQEIDSIIQRINAKWDNPPARNGHWGNVLKSVSIKNVRGMNITCELSWPVTVVGGSNGCGKTTLLQACSSAYIREVRGRYYKLGDWIRAALSGESPAITDPAEINYSFWDPQVESFTVPYQREDTRWRYPRRGNPIRNVEFIGIALFAPRIERKDRVNVFKSKLRIQNIKALPTEAVQSICKILGTTYTEACFLEVGVENGRWKDSLPELKKGDYTYTEPQMGAGEQKILRLVDSLEAIPSQSLILLEEPELTLHPDAQRGLAWYLMNLSFRKGHQIIVASHATDIFETVPQRARVLLIRESRSVQIFHNAPFLRVARELAASHRSNKEIILVEDTVGADFLRNVLQRYSIETLQNSSIVPVGNTDDVYRLVTSLRRGGVNAIGVRDADTGDAPADGLFSLPGDQLPESLLLDDINIANTESLLSGIKASCERAKVSGLGKTGAQKSKAIFASLKSEYDEIGISVADRLTMAWLTNNAPLAQSLIANIRTALDSYTAPQ